MIKFEDLGLSESTIKALNEKGFEEPTQIQAKVIPLLLSGELDVIGQAQTGTGKTAAFGLPLIEKLGEEKGHVQALILAPTRELALQVSEEINSLKGRKKLKVISIYGGQSMTEQLRRLKKGVDIVVGTPGRVIDHINRGSLKLDNISHLVLDEADEMLNMGFLEDVENIFERTNQDKNTLLFSATMPKSLLNIADRFMRDKKIVSVKKESLTTNLTNQIYFEVSSYDKFEALCRLIDIEHDFFGMIFCRTKVETANLAVKLAERGYDADALHGDVSQNFREQILDKFRNKTVNILVATDVAARGIDINDLTHVINYSLPQNPEAYVHRIGRTGRAGKQGTAITFVTPDEYRKLVFITKVTKTKITREKLPEVKDIIKSKVTRLKSDIQNIMKIGREQDYMELAAELLEGNDDPAKVLASMIRHTFAEELDQNSYKEIRTINESSMDRKGKTRLFVARGTDDGMTPRKMVEFIEHKTKIDNIRLRNVDIFDKYSFITVSFEDAEIILKFFKTTGRNKKPLVVKAKSKQNSNRGRHSGHGHKHSSSHRSSSRGERSSGHGHKHSSKRA